MKPYCRQILACMVMMSFPLAALAKTVQVGGCLTHVSNYSTIQEAVTAVDPASTILICPGSYPEQIVISKPLTLRGITSGNSANPTITVPSGGLTASVTLLSNGVTMYYQVLAQGSGTDQINIENIAVNGNGNLVGNKGWLSGIYYRAASGSMERLAVFNQIGNGLGFGIFLESGGPPNLSTISIINNSIHDFDNEGIRSNAGSTPPSLTVEIKDNSVVMNNSATLYSSANAIDIDGVGQISGNSLASPSLIHGGIAGYSGLTISENTIQGFQGGVMVLGNNNTITTNRISFFDTAIGIFGQNNVVQHNQMADSSQGIAIGFNCTGTANNVTQNTINDVGTGVEEDPGGNTVTPNLFTNVANIIVPTCP